jgi:hypothetical protein
MSDHSLITRSESVHWVPFSLCHFDYMLWSTYYYVAFGRLFFFSISGTRAITGEFVCLGTRSFAPSFYEEGYWTYPVCTMCLMSVCLFLRYAALCIWNLHKMFLSFCFCIWNLHRMFLSFCFSIVQHFAFTESLLLDLSSLLLDLSSLYHVFDVRLCVCFSVTQHFAFGIYI